MSKVKGYECPLCHERYATMAEAEACLEDCKDQLTITPVQLYVCDVCGKRFSDWDEALIHEVTCTSFEVCDEPTCMNCTHRDREGFYHRPCLQYNHAPVIPACANFEQVTR